MWVANKNEWSQATIAAWSVAFGKILCRLFRVKKGRNRKAGCKEATATQSTTTAYECDTLQCLKEVLYTCTCSSFRCCTCTRSHLLFVIPRIQQNDTLTINFQNILPPTIPLSIIITGTDFWPCFAPTFRKSCSCCWCVWCPLHRVPCACRPILVASWSTFHYLREHRHHHHHHLLQIDLW